jgi:hypothetical protein
VAVGFDLDVALDVRPVDGQPGTRGECGERLRSGVTVFVVDAGRDDGDRWL